MDQKKDTSVTSDIADRIKSDIRKEMQSFVEKDSSPEAKKEVLGKIGELLKSYLAVDFDIVTTEVGDNRVDISFTYSDGAVALKITCDKF